MEAVRRVWGGCLQGVGRLSEGIERLSIMCLETIWRVMMEEVCLNVG